MNVHFIAHAGFCVSTSTATVMLDPWFFSSTLDQPVLHGLLPPNKTIDFQTPECKDRIESFRPHAILVSHFHTHHAPLKDIQMLIRQRSGEKIVLGTPTVSGVNREKILAALGEGCRDSVDLLSVKKEEPLEFQVGDIKVRGFTHTWNDHAAWILESPSGTFMHIADARLNRDSMSRQIDSLWMQFRDLRPDLLVFSSAGHCLKRKDDQGRPWILEHGTMSPVEAARLVSLIRPRAAAAMGVYQRSIWTDRLEYSMSADFVESEFAWALNYLSPEIRSLRLTPGENMRLERVAEINQLFERQIPRDL